MVNSSVMLLYINKRNLTGTYIQQCIWLHTNDFEQKLITVHTECVIVSVEHQPALQEQDKEGVCVRERQRDRDRRRDTYRKKILKLIYSICS